MEFVENFLAHGQVPGFDAYARDFFDWGSSTYLARRRNQKRRQMSQGTAASPHGIVHNHLIPAFGALPLDKINLGAFEGWLLAKPISNLTKNHVLYTLNINLKEAVRRGHLPRNPLQGIEALDPNNRERDYLLSEELKKLFPREMDAFLKKESRPHFRGTMSVLSGGIVVGVRIVEPWAPCGITAKHQYSRPPSLLVAHAKRLSECAPVSRLASQSFDRTESPGACPAWKRLRSS